MQNLCYYDPPIFPKNLKDYAPWVAKYGLRCAYGLCQCGCGEYTHLAPFTHARDGHLEGHPMQRLYGHSGIHAPLQLRVKTVEVGKCIVWNGLVNSDGYGLLRIGGKNQLAHRYAWVLENGPIPEGLCLLHQCDNPPCVSTKHLRLGTVQDNMADKVSKGRHARGELHGRSKLTQIQVEEIKELRAQGMLLREIAEIYGINFQSVSNIANSKRWKHVK